MPSSAFLHVRSVRLRGAGIAICGAFLLSCGGEGPTGPGPAPVVASVVVSPGADTLVTVGRTRQFVAEARDAAGIAIPGLAFTWSSADTTIATVSSSGVVTARASGVVSITAAVNAVQGSGQMAVVQFVAGVTVTPGTAAASSVGDTSQFSAVARDSSGATVPGVRFLWTSSNTGVATVDTLGRAIATGSGATTISATGRGTPGYAELTVSQAVTQLVFTGQPTNTIAGAAIDPGIEVEVRDARGAVAKDFRGSVTLAIQDSAAGATLGGTRTVNAVAGVARFSGIWLNRAKNAYTLRATVEGIAPVESEAFNVAAGPAARLEVSLTDTLLETDLAGDDTLHVAFFDAYDNPATPAPVQLRLQSGTRANALLRYRFAVFTEHTLMFTAFRVSQAGNDFTVEAASNSLRATSPRFASRTTFTSVAVGATHACGIAGGGTFCWGSNQVGQLGSFGEADSIPRKVALDLPLVAIDANLNRTCGVTADGQAFCWGSNALFAAQTPQAVPNTGPAGVSLASVSVGEDHACGRGTGGEVYCWGNNTLGQVGEGELGSQTLIPRQIPASGAAGFAFTAIATGDRHSCGIAPREDGAEITYCWGSSQFGQLGDGIAGGFSKPTREVSGSGTDPLLFKRLATGRGHGCGASTSTVFCWGLNTAGQVGAGVADSLVLDVTALTLEPGTTVVDVDAGGDATCAITSSGASATTRCWGANAFGQLGTGDYSGRNLPSTVQLPYSASQISVGGSLACAVTTNGVYCWGRNQVGQLGIGTLTLVTSAYPVRIVQ